MDAADVIRRYHSETAHSPRPQPRTHLEPGFRPMEAANRPVPFKRYRDLVRQPLPTDLRPPGAAGPAALDVLAGRVEPVAPSSVDDDLLARLLHCSGGITRYSERGTARAWFRASASAGNLHPLELYVAGGPSGGGLYHFDPESFSLGRLRPTDVRPHLARAAADAALAGAGAVIVVTGVPWRTAWKYGERGWRHVHWDAGSLLANLLAVAEAHRVPARVVTGFVDREVCHILGIDGTSEHPVALVAVGEVDPAAGQAPPPAGLGRLDTLRPAVDPLSARPVELPLVVAAQRASDLDDRDAVDRWHDACAADGPGGATGAASTGPVPTPALAAAPEPIEELVLRRGSTRVMERRRLPGAALDAALRMATRAVPLDAVAWGRTLLDHQIAVHDVEGHPAGLYRWADATLQARADRDEEATRDLSMHLCLGQPLGGDSAYTVFESADLDAVLERLGPRGYRAAHVEAGIVNGRFLLAAHALGHGATGLTFFDDEVRAAFDIPVGCLLVTAVGTAAYRPTPGGWPGHPTRLGHYGELMARLEARLHGGTGIG